MINFEALFKVSYGLYIVASGDKNRGNGYISNTVFQVTAEPPQFATCCNKNNFTAGLIKQSGGFSVSVLHQDASPDLFGRFGYRSGKDYNKLEGMQLLYGTTGVPIVLNDAIAYLEYRVVQTVDAGTHLLFIGELLQSVLLDDTKDPLTYLYYRQVKKGIAPKNAPTYVDKSKLVKTAASSVVKEFKCTACGYIYDEGKENQPFAGLPETWVCPVCGCGKEDFIEI